MDNRILVFLISLAATALSLFIGVAIGSGEIFIPSLLLVALGAFALIAKPPLASFCAVAFCASGLTAPGLPGQFGLYYVSIAAVVAIGVVLVAFKRISLPKLEPVHLFLSAFCCVVFFTGLYRGFGFQFLGSHLWGGFHYVAILMPAMLVFMLPQLNMPANWWRTAIVLMGLLSTLPLLADILVIFGIPFGFVRAFLQTSAAIGRLVSEYESGEGLNRFTSAGLAAQSMVVAFLAVFHTNKLFNLKAVPAIAILTAIMVLSLFSGFRLMTAMLPTVVLLCAFYQGSLTANRIIFGLCSLGVGIILIYSISDFLPYNAQRAVSWLPGISVSSAALQDAEGTVQWRLDLWREAIRLIPEYFWVGKGLSYDANLYLASMTGYASYDALNWALITGGYHNGYLSLLLGFGIFGFVTGLSLLVMVALRHIRLNNASWNHAVLHQCHQAFLASNTCLVLVYLTVYGDVSAVFPQFFFNWAALEAIRKCDEQHRSSASQFRDRPETSEDDLAILE